MSLFRSMCTAGHGTGFCAANIHDYAMNCVHNSFLKSKQEFDNSFNYIIDDNSFDSVCRV